MPAFKFDAKRWTQTDRIIGISTLVLFIALFLPWFGYSIAIYNFTVDGLWHGYEYLVLILCLAVMAYLVARAGFEELPLNRSFVHHTGLLIATVVNFVLVLIGFLDKPGGSAVGWRFGAFVALIAAAIAAAPLAIPAIQARTKKPAS